MLGLSLAEPSATKPLSSTARSGRLNQWQTHGWLLVANDQSRAGLRRVCGLGNAVGSCELILGRSLHRCSFGCVAIMGRPSHATLTLHLRLLHATWPGIKRTIALFDLQRLRSLHVSVCSACALYLSVPVAVVRSPLQRLRSGCGCSACALVGNACMRLRSIVVVTLAIVIVLFGSACALVVIAALALWSIMYVCVYSSPQLCVATI